MLPSLQESPDLMKGLQDLAVTWGVSFLNVLLVVSSGKDRANKSKGTEGPTENADPIFSSPNLSTNRDGFRPSKSGPIPTTTQGEAPYEQTGVG